VDRTESGRVRARLGSLLEAVDLDARGLSGERFRLELAEGGNAGRTDTGFLGTITRESCGSLLLGAEGFDFNDLFFLGGGPLHFW